MATLHRRLLVALAAVPILFFVAHWTFRAVVSRAIAFAPNGGGVGAAPASTAPPPGAITVSVSVDSPPATLSTWIMVP